jgi:hypothetical protein
MKYLLFSITAFCTFFGCVFPQVAGTADDVNSGSILGCIVRGPRATGDTVTVNLYRTDTVPALLKRRSDPKAPLKTLKTIGTTYRFDSLAAGSYGVHVLSDSIIVGKKENINLTSSLSDTVNIPITIIVNIMLSIQYDPHIAYTGVSIDNGKVKTLESGYLLTIAEVDTQYIGIKFDRGADTGTTQVRLILHDNQTAKFEPMTDSISPVLTSSYESDCLIPGAVVCLPFDDGKADDASGNGNHGRVVGAVPTTDRFNRPNAALRFNGKDNYVIVDTLRGTITGNTPKSISGWFRSEYYSKYLQMLFGFGAQIPGNNFQIGAGPLGSGLDTPYVFRVNGWGDSYDWRTGIPAIKFFDGRWHHCVLAYDGSTTMLYFDGALAAQTTDTTYDTASATQTATDGIPIRDTLFTYDRLLARYDTTFIRIKNVTNFHYITPSAPVLVIGREIDLNEWEFEGDLDDIRIFNRAIDANEVKLLYNQTSKK